MTMFGKMKQFAMKKVMQSQMKDMPDDQKAMIEGLMEKNPQLLETIAKEMQAEMKTNGNNQMAAAMKVLPKYQSQLQAAMGPEMVQKMAQMQGGAGGGKFGPDGRPF